MHQCHSSVDRSESYLHRQHAAIMGVWQLEPTTIYTYMTTNALNVPSKNCIFFAKLIEQEIRLSVKVMLVFKDLNL